MKEIAAAKNIKNRSNRQNVSRLFNINLNTHFGLGLFCFVGIDEYGDEIIEQIEPDIKLDLFYYSCANKFETHITAKYIGSNIAETIVFARIAKESRHIYVVRICDRLNKLKNEYNSNNLTNSTNLINSTNSAELNIHIFGSEEIVEIVVKQSPVKLINRGFLNFNLNTIGNTKYWINILNKSAEKNYDFNMLKYLNIWN